VGTQSRIANSTQLHSGICSDTDESVANRCVHRGDGKHLLLAFYRDYFVAHCVVDKLCQRMEAKLKHDFTAMSLHGSDGDSEPR
jgi:hypothetical protein